MSNFKTAPTAITLAPAQNRIISFTDEAGTQIQISQEDVLAYICDKATPQEVVFFMELCRSQKLNPFKREAYLVKFGSSPAQMITAEIVFERRANAHPDYMGIECGIVYMDANGNIHRREGTATYKAAGERLLGGWARVHRRGRTDAYAEVTLDEYNKNQSLWKQMPGVMIHKCAKATALRLAFPSDFQGMYVEEEMNVAPNVVEIHADVMPVKDADAPESAQDGEYGPISVSADKQAEFNNIVANLAAVRGKKEGDVALAVLNSKAVMNTGYQLGTDMTDIQMEVAINVAKGWLVKAVESQEEQAMPTYEQPAYEQTYDGPDYEQMPLYEEG